MHNFPNELVKAIERAALEYNDKIDKIPENKKQNGIIPMFSNDMILHERHRIPKANKILQTKPKKHIGPLKWIDKYAKSVISILRYLNPLEDEYTRNYDHKKDFVNQYHHQPIEKFKGLLLKESIPS